MNARLTGRLLLYAIIISLLILCSAPDLLAGCLDDLDLPNTGSRVSAWTHLTLLASLLTAFALLRLLTLRAAGRRLYAHCAPSGAASLCAPALSSWPKRKTILLMPYASSAGDEQVPAAGSTSTVR